jgi:hypothetical protein
MEANNVVVLCPTRERPEKAAEMVESFRDTATTLATEIVLVVDDDDLRLADYLALPDKFNKRSSGPLWPPDPVRVMVIPVAEGGSLTAATNTLAARIWGEDCIIGHVGDDHRFETNGWDKRIMEALHGRHGVAYGDDGFWHEALPTAAFLTSSIPRALGWYANPLCHHYGIDDTWGDLGRGIGSLHYLPDVRITQPGPHETMLAGDDVYWRAQVNREADAAAYFTWRDGPGRIETLERLRAALR